MPREAPRREGPTPPTPTARGEVLVAIMNHRLDFALARDQHWYRIPVSSVEKWLKGRWPPRWLAFYQTKVFGSEAFAVNYYCQVLDVREVPRWQLFPDQPRDDKGLRRYHQLLLGPLQRLPRPIVSRRWRKHHLRIGRYRAWKKRDIGFSSSGRKRRPRIRRIISTGTIVIARIDEKVMANVLVSARGRNILPSCPDDRKVNTVLEEQLIRVHVFPDSTPDRRRPRV